METRGSKKRNIKHFKLVKLVNICKFCNYRSRIVSLRYNVGLNQYADPVRKPLRARFNGADACIRCSRLSQLCVTHDVFDLTDRRRPDMMYLEALSDGLERVLMVHGGGKEVITMYE